MFDVPKVSMFFFFISNRLTFQSATLYNTKQRLFDRPYIDTEGAAVKIGAKGLEMKKTQQREKWDELQRVEAL